MRKSGDRNIYEKVNVSSARGVMNTKRKQFVLIRAYFFFIGNAKAIGRNVEEEEKILIKLIRVL